MIHWPFGGQIYSASMLSGYLAKMLLPKVSANGLNMSRKYLQNAKWHEQQLLFSMRNVCWCKSFLWTFYFANIQRFLFPHLQEAKTIKWTENFGTVQHRRNIARRIAGVSSNAPEWNGFGEFYQITILAQGEFDLLWFFSISVGSIARVRLASRITYNLLGNGTTLGFDKRGQQQLHFVHSGFEWFAGEIPERFRFLTFYHRSDSGE